VAETLQAAHLGTLLFDLLTREEEQRDAVTAELRFDIEMLSERLIAATHWAHERAPGLRLGYFGASTGAAAALLAAAETRHLIGANVARGGRADLAEQSLPNVRAPTLLIVGSLDEAVVRLNQQAYERLECEKQLTIIPGASHLFSEPGTLDQVARHAADWFQRHLTQGFEEQRHARLDQERRTPSARPST
jgi:dienelactone hydrolase